MFIAPLFCLSEDYYFDKFDALIGNQNINDPQMVP